MYMFMARNFDHEDGVGDKSSQYVSQDDTQKLIPIESTDVVDRRSSERRWTDGEPQLPNFTKSAEEDPPTKDSAGGSEKKLGAEKGFVSGLQLANAGTLASIAGSVICDTVKASIRSLLITSCHDGEGKTVSAINMACGVVREAGKRAVIVDSNPDSPILHEQFGLSRGIGLTDLLHARCSIRDVLHPTDLEGLWFLSLGTPLKGRLEVLSHRNLPIVIDRLAQSFDLVLVDGPSVYGATNPAVMASIVDGLVMVVECERTRWAVLKSAKGSLELAGANVISVIMNRRKYYIPKRLYG